MMWHAFFFLALSAVSASAIPVDLVGRISATIKTGPQSSAGTGATGILLNSDGDFLTNLHNIWPCAQALGEAPWEPTQKLTGKECPPENLEVHFPLMKPPLSARGAKIVALGSLAMTGSLAPYRDWVLLRLRLPKREKIAIELSIRTPREGAKIAAYGFPVTSVGESVVEGSNLRRTEGTVLEPQRTLRLWKTIYEKLSLSPEQLTGLERVVVDNFFTDSPTGFHDAPIIAGYSGSPVFDDRGALVGILWGNISFWNYSFGEYPAKDLGADPARPDKPANRLSSFIQIPEAAIRAASPR